MYEIDRYGLVMIDKNHKIESFQEKTYRDEALINSGLYYLNKSAFNDKTPEGNFSMETDYFEKYFSKGILGGFPYEAFFRDIGIPEDFNLAQDEFRQFKYQ
jgi:D-glycero-alpha-D-manno-heptose 1-phosphate guanylyltransferase